jgi:hypothetical protein
MKRTFENALQLGKIGEQIFDLWLRADQNRNVIYTGGEGIEEGRGNLLRTPQGDIITPDFYWFRWQAMPDGRSRKKEYWGDVKTKESWAWYNKAQCWKTGIDLASLDMYRLLENHTQQRCHLFFIQLRSDTPYGECPTGLFGNNLMALFDSRFAQCWQENGMIYWSEQALKQWATLDELAAGERAQKLLAQAIEFSLQNNPKQNVA